MGLPYWTEFNRANSAKTRSRSACNYRNVVLPQTPTPIRWNNATGRHNARSETREQAERLSKIFTILNNEKTNKIEVQLTNLPSNIPKTELYTTKEVEKENLRKAPELDRITSRMLKELPRKCTVLITYTFNSMLTESHRSEQLKTAEFILIPKP